MQEVFNFIFSHYEAILSVLTLIISIVVLIIRKRPVNAIFADIYTFSIQAINDAERTDLHGSDKLSFAVERVAETLLNKYPALDIDKYRLVIRVFIENILSTPQKKNGGNI